MDRPRKRNPGRNIAERERNTARVVLRLPPDVAERLRDLATRRRLTVSGLVAELLPHF